MQVLHAPGHSVPHPPVWSVAVPPGGHGLPPHCHCQCHWHDGAALRLPHGWLRHCSPICSPLGDLVRLGSAPESCLACLHCIMTGLVVSNGIDGNLTRACSSACCCSASLLATHQLYNSCRSFKFRCNDSITCVFRLYWANPSMFATRALIINEFTARKPRALLMGCCQSTASGTRDHLQTKTAHPDCAFVRCNNVVKLQCEKAPCVVCQCSPAALCCAAA